MTQPHAGQLAEPDFAQLIERLRGGDQQAAAELVEQFTPEVRRFVRFRLSSPALRRTFDSLDVCQSVLCRFFVEVSAGGLELRDPQQLKALLMTMARNKLVDRVREAHADCRDARRVAAGDGALQTAADSSASPSEVLSAAEIMAAVRDRLSEEEKHLVDQRLAGRGWDDLASELGASPDALRKRMTRALDDAAAHLGLRDH